MSPSDPTKTRRRSKHGFALIVTVSLLVMLSLIALGFLSLSAVTLRGSSVDQAAYEARNNARLALQIAIGELQKQLGPDQRISANGAIISESDTRHPHWTGVWDAWVAGDPADAPVKEDYPSPASHHQTIGTVATDTLRPDYDKEKYFRSWLVSLEPTDAQRFNSALGLNLNPTLSPSADDTAVFLVERGSLGDGAEAEDFVGARLLDVKDTANGSRGRYAWWVSDESQKACIMDDSYKLSLERLSNEERLARQKAPAAVTREFFPGLEDVNDEEQLEMITSRNSIQLVDGATEISGAHFHDSTITSLGLLADVREGGMKRDLSTLLEREIDPSEVYEISARPETEFDWPTGLAPDGEDFLLYSFDDQVQSVVNNPYGQATVPIQDLASYYQLYDSSRPDSRGGIQYSSRDSSPPNNQMTNGFMVSNPDYGRTRSDYDRYLRQHTALYRSAVPVKIEMMLSYVTEPRSPADMQRDRDNGITDPDPYNLRIGVSPAITYWNPNNVPMVMNIGDPDRDSIMVRETPIPLSVTFRKSNSIDGEYTAERTVQFNKITNTQQGELYTFFISGNYSTVFGPGESKVFALRFASGTDAGTANNYADFMLRGRGNRRFAETFVDELELVPGWNPERFIRPRSDTGGSGRGDHNVLTFNAGDFISAEITGGNYNSFTADFTQKSRHGRRAPGVMWHYRTFMFKGRLNRSRNGATYRNDFVYQGFPNEGTAISSTRQRSIEVAPRRAENLIAAMGSRFNPRDDLPMPFFYYGIKAATETHESLNMSPVLGGAGRRFPSRPFTHSTSMIPPFVDSTEPNSLYNYGWNWFFQPLTNILDAPVSISRNDSGYFGGGYTAENGTTHVVQQHLPLTPPISIAALSHAHLGGHSIATEAAAPGYWGLRDPWNRESFSRTTAVGFGGLMPHTLQAIGNSYAHPNIPPDEAVWTWDRYFTDQGAPRLSRDPFVDHSYLANKALWDDFFFSSIYPKPLDVEIFDEEQTVEDLLSGVFFEDKALPNPRILPRRDGLSEEDLNDLLSEYDVFTGGFADKIASHLMVEGPFNINSTSVAAWKALFSSLRGHNVSYLDKTFSVLGGQQLDTDPITSGDQEFTPVLNGSLPNGRSYQGSSSDPSDGDQWVGIRKLTDDEVDQLANAMVEQVKKRGPFLSLSEFMNRRLDPNNTDDMALKGALQAAIDDPSVSINEGFRNNNTRTFSARESGFVNAEFPKAMEGPVAYGSAAYVDQADLLRALPAQLTPRGDTFVIRAYGDSIDAEGNVVARAWCEATVQRLPAYLDPADEPFLKQSDLTSEVNRKYGRKFVITQFRWLEPSEI